jgi:uncharacterized membrane protein
VASIRKSATYKHKKQRKVNRTNIKTNINNKDDMMIVVVVVVVVVIIIIIIIIITVSLLKWCLKLWSEE